MTCSVSGEDKLVSVEEVDTCNYLVFVQTPLLCSLPLFQQLQHGSRTVISCSPLVSRETYTRYIGEWLAPLGREAGDGGGAENRGGGVSNSESVIGY